MLTIPTCVTRGSRLPRKKYAKYHIDCIKSNIFNVLKNPMGKIVPFYMPRN